MKRILLLAAVVLSGCQSITRPEQPDLNKYSYQELLANQSRWQNDIKTLQGKMRITLDTPEFSGNFYGELLVKGSDSLLLSLEAQLGIKVGKVFLSKNRFLFYDQLNNQFYQGSRSQFEQRNFLQFPVTLRELQEVMTARNSFNILKRKSYEVRDANYYLGAENGHYDLNIWFEPQSRLIRRIEYLDNSQLEKFREYGEFQQVNGYYFPQVINFVRPQEKEGIAVFYENIRINEAIDESAFNIKISDSAVQMDLGI